MFKRYVFTEGFTNLLWSNGKYLININGQIKDIEGNDVDYRRDDEGHLTVHCSGWDGERSYRVVDLIAIQFKDLRISELDYVKVKAFVIDGDKNNTHAGNVGYRFIGGPLEHRQFPGLFYIPSMTSRCMDVSGNVYCSLTGREKRVSMTKPNLERNIRGGYKTFTSTFSGHAGRTVGRHRAYCLTFKEYPDNVDKLTVNHKNGIAGDDHLDNLEWSTYGENNKHAYVNDLKNQHFRILVRDVLTGEVEEYYSISECSRVLGYATDETIRHRLRCPFGQVFQDGKQFKLKKDERSWVIPENPEEAVKRAMGRIAIKIAVRDCETGVTAIHGSMTDASTATGVLSSTIGFRLRSDNRKPCFGYQFKRADDARPWPSHSEDEYVRSKEGLVKALDARNLLTGEVREFLSVREAGMFIGNSALGKYFKRGEQPLTPSGWQLKYKDDEWDQIDDFEEAIYKLQKEITCRCEVTGKIMVADSAQALSEILHLDPKAIRLAAFTRGNKVYKGYRFRLGVKPEAWPNTQSACVSV